MFGTGYLAESVMYSKSEVSMRIKILITYDMFYLMKTQNHLKAHVAKYYQMKIDFGIKIMISAKPICRRITNITQNPNFIGDLNNYTDRDEQRKHQKVPPAALESVGPR